MHKIFLKIFTPLFILSFFAIPHGFVLAEGIPSPIITSVSPSIIYTGDQVEIIGQNFGNTPDIYAKVILIPEYGSPSPKIVGWSDTKITIQINKENIYSYNTNALKVFDDGQNISTYIRSPFSNEFPIKILSALCKENTWSCYDWGTCSMAGTQTRICTKAYKSFDCLDSFPPSPATLQNCTPPPQPVTPITPPLIYQPSQPPQPSCTADIWSCDGWGACSLSGVQNRSCRKTFDCSSVETAPPVTDQYCESPSKPTQQAPQDLSQISNQDAIIKATIKLICPLDESRASQGSGTVIDSSGTILTNKHVVDGTIGCLVGFISDFNDEPYFGDRQIADIQKVSSGEDVAVLKLRNPQNRKLIYINIANSNGNFRLGTKVNIYGYPAKFGTNITYTSGDFSGTSGSYLKTTAIIEHGNSGGGAYLNDGTFIGVPSAVIKGELNALGYILSISTINAWLGNSSITYNNSNQNNYSRVSSILEKIDLKKLNSLELVITGTKEANSKATQNSSTTSPSIIKKSVPSQIQKETSNTGAEPSIQNQNDKSVKSNQEIHPNNNPASIQNTPQLQPSLVKRFINWITSWFK